MVSRAFEAFRREVEIPPPLTLRGGNAVDGYAVPAPFDSAVDEPTDAYFEGFAFWGLGYLDARSWRHYLPRLIVVAGSLRAERLDGLTHGDSPAEPQTLAIVVAEAGNELVTLSVRSWPRGDLDREVARILESFEIVG